jgi:hypothetical protein
MRITWRVLACGWVALWVVIFARADSYDYVNFAIVCLFPLLFVYLVCFLAIPGIVRAVKKRV